VQSPHVNSLEHAVSLDAHALVIQRQSLQLPAVGPVDVPVAQLEVLWHQPQLPPPVHVPQSPLPAHGSGGAHSELSQRQSKQKPSFGPALLPLRHSSLLSHQAHGSAGMHMLVVQRQSLQKPANGPTESPDWHSPLASHHPHPARAEQLPQSALEAHGSAAVHALANHAQSLHEPVVGPVDDPV
jgi:hypothetical protein